ncbi:PP2C family protein-serine/threonine phosphatase [Streptomyces sp. NPDC052236]|uniref:PP2C family protein-serine/threonine phosphatase n=1 Tax=Streptomyces sp. NPDC052236 TaxID=3365686 RepID=UPI0037D70152
MPSHVFADRPAPQPPERGTVDALISRTRKLRGDVDAVRRDAVVDDDDPQGRWQRALCNLAVHQLDDLDAHLGQLKEGLTAEPTQPVESAEAPESTESTESAESKESAGSELAEHAADHARSSGSLLSRVGTAEWNLLTDEVSWSEELYQILGRSPQSVPMSLDEFPSMVFPDDQALLTALVTDCLVDGRPIDGEFRMIRSDDNRVRTVHMMGEPVLDADGSTAAMWAVLRDVSELRRSQRAVHESSDSLRRREHFARTERRLAVEFQEAVLPPWRGSLRFPQSGPTALDVFAHYLPSTNSALIGGDWYDALQLPSGECLLSVGDLTGHGVTATSSMAMLLGALRGMAVAGIRPGALMTHLNQLLDSSVQPALGSAVCCRYDPASRTLQWAQAGHPAPLLFRNGTGQALTPPDGVLLGATRGAAYEQAELRLLPGDLLVLHTDGLTRPNGAHDPDADRVDRLLALAPRFADARDAQECVRTVVEEFGVNDRADDACVMVARIGA